MTLLWVRDAPFMSKCLRHRHFDTSTPRHLLTPLTPLTHINSLSCTTHNSCRRFTTTTRTQNVSTISDVSLHHCLPELLSMARFNLCVILEITLSQIFEKHWRRGGLGTYVQAWLLWCSNIVLPALGQSLICHCTIVCLN